MEDLPITDRLRIPGALLSWTAVRSSGAGGQNVNKVSTKVELRFELARWIALPSYARTRLKTLARRYMTVDGALVITSQLTRSQGMNLEDARNKLADLVRQSLRRPKRRVPTKPSRRAKERRLRAKRLRAMTKRGRGKVTVDD